MISLHQEMFNTLEIIPEENEISFCYDNNIITITKGIQKEKQEKDLLPIEENFGSLSNRVDEE